MIRETIARFFAPSVYRRIEEHAKTTVDNLSLVSESFQQLAQIAREDLDYVRIGETYGKFFSPSFVKQIIQQARLYYVKNPVIRRGVHLQCMYVWGKGYALKGKDDATTAYLDTFRAVNERWLSVQGLSNLETKMLTDGNLFIALFTSEELGTVQLRRIDPLEIGEIVCDPEDKDTELLYLRTWTEAGGDVRNAWYPALHADPEQIERAQVNLRGHPMETTPVYHQCIETHESPWGIPDFYAAIDWAGAYKQFLEGWSSIQSIFRTFGLTATTDGGQKKIEAIKTALQTSISTGHPIESNPAPQLGSTFIAGPNTKLAALKTAGSTEGPEEGRRILLMAIMVFGAPETMFGDASVGTVATAFSLDRPTELKYRQAQERWREFLRTVSEYAVLQARIAPGGALRGRQGELKRLRDANTQPWVMVEFPDILEHEIDKAVAAIVQGATLGGSPLAGTMDIRTLSLLLLNALGADDPNLIVDQMYPPDSYDPQAWATLTPEERAEQAADMADRAALAGRNAEESAALEMARIAHQLAKQVKEASAGGAQ